jgi:hypothetical protein
MRFENAPHLIERQPVGRIGTALRCELTRKLGDGLFEIWIVAGEREGGFVVHERLGQIAAPVKDFGDAADGGKVFRGALEDELQLAPGFVELAELEEGAPHGDASREVAGMKGEAGAARADRVGVLTGAAILFRELGEGDRRRVAFDPASQILDARVLCH